jgi:hypothetical protein
MLMEQGGEKWWLVEPEGPTLDANALLACAGAYEAELLVVPTHRLPPTFFTGKAEDVIRPLVARGLRLAVIGPVDLYCDHSEAFKTFAREANRGREVAIQPDMAALLAHMTKK